MTGWLKVKTLFFPRQKVKVVGCGVGGCGNGECGECGSDGVLGGGSECGGGGTESGDSGGQTWFS